MRKEPSLAEVLREIQAIRQDIRATNRALLSIPEAATYLGLAQKTLRNRIGPKATDPFPVKAVRVGGRVLFRRTDLERYVAGLGQ